MSTIAKESLDINRITRIDDAPFDLCSSEEQTYRFIYLELPIS